MKPILRRLITPIAKASCKHNNKSRHRIEKAAVFLLCLLLLSPCISFSQIKNTYIIDYSTLGGSDICNPLANGLNVSGFMHYSTIGYPYYYAGENDEGLWLEVGYKPSSASHAGTEYQIAFNFVKNRTYSIAISNWFEQGFVGDAINPDLYLR